jgi:hypothetical protein
MEIRDHVWTRRRVAALPADAKIADFAAKRRSSEAVAKPVR